MRIAIDMQGALTHGSRGRGIGRYSLRLTSAMAALDRSPELHLMLNDNHGADGPVLSDPAIAKLPAVAISRYKVPFSPAFAAIKTTSQRRAADVIVRRHVAAREADAVLFTSCFEMAAPDFSPVDLKAYPASIKAAILYDLIPLIYSDHYLKDDRTKRCYLEIVDTLKSADLLLAISEASRRDAIAKLGIEPHKIVNISSAGDPRFRRLEIPEAQRTQMAARFGIRRPFVFYVAGADMRKNLRGAIAAFAALPHGLRRAHQLLLVSNLGQPGQSEHLQLAADLGLEPDELVLSGPVEDDDLIVLMNMCRAFLFASLYEGFGLPVLEAMQCGTALLAGNNSSIPEIVDRKDILFDASSTDSMASALARVLTDDALRADLAEWGPRRAKGFTWQRCAHLAVDAVQARLEASRSSGTHVLPCELLDLDGARVEIADVLRKAPDGAAHVEEIVDSLLFSVPKFQQGSRRLLIDVTDCRKSGAWTGIQRVVRKLTAAFYELDIGDGFVPVAVEIDGVQPRTVPDFVSTTLGRTSAIRAHEIEIRPGDDLFMLDSNWIAYPDLTPLFARVRRGRGRLVTAIYDIIPELHPEFCGVGMPPAHARWLHAAVASSDALLCISRAVADEVVDYVARNRLPHPSPLKIGWFHLGSDIVRVGGNPVPLPHVAQVFDARRATFLVIGTLEPRKGHAVALDAFERLWNAGVDVGLCFMGVRGWKCEQLETRIRTHREHGKRLFWFIDAKDADVVHGYARAAAVLCPSLAEGFGLPIAEAGWMERPAICSDIAVFREVGGEGAVYFRSGDPNSLASAVQDWLDGRLRADPSRVSRNTWGEAALRVRDVLEEDEWYRVLE